MTLGKSKVNPYHRITTLNSRRKPIWNHGDLHSHSSAMFKLLPILKSILSYNVLPSAFPSDCNILDFLTLWTCLSQPSVQSISQFSYLFGITLLLPLPFTVLVTVIPHTWRAFFLSLWPDHFPTTVSTMIFQSFSSLHTMTPNLGKLS